MCQSAKVPKQIFVLGGAWDDNAEKLSRFFHQNFVNRTDAYGRYKTDAYGRYNSVQSRIKSPAITIHEEVTTDILCKHFRASDRGELIGLHTTSPSGTSRWLVIDVDQHGDADPEINRSFILHCYEKAERLGLKPLLIDSNGLGGFHLWIVFNDPVDTRTVYQIGNWLIHDSCKFGLVSKPEVFPKQRTLKPEQLGNWVRLPGLHHTLDFYSRVWNGSEWLEGQSAINQIFELEKVSNDCIQKVVSAISHDDSGQIGSVKNRRVPDPEEINSWVTTLQSHAIAKNLLDKRRYLLARFLARLKNVSQCSDGWSACCPAHADSNPSLSINIGEDTKFLVHCHRGCEFMEILSATDTPPTDMFNSGSNEPISVSTQNRPRAYNIKPTPANPELIKLNQVFRDPAVRDHLEYLAKKLGVSYASLDSLGVGWSKQHRCWTFPEKNGEQKLCGIIRRGNDGSKYAIKGSKRGLILPSGWELKHETLYICEGASDVAAALTHNLRAIGRPNLNGGFKDLAVLLKDLSEDIVVIADNDSDGKGLIGAQKLAQMLVKELNKKTRVGTVLPQFKDFREYLRSVK